MRAFRNSLRSVFISLLVAASVAHAGPVEDLLPQAQAGNAAAQFQLGTAYDFGRGVPRDSEMAKKWYLAAADQGHAEAQNSLGNVYQAAKNYEDAMPWYEKAASQGNAAAINNMAYLHDLGLGTPRNRQYAFELYSESADLGWGEAMWNLANMYGAGQLGPRDLYKACLWILRAERFSEDHPQLKAYARRVKPELLKALGARAKSCEEESAAWSPQAAQK
jgi:TPR repeat protein